MIKQLVFGGMLLLLTACAPSHQVFKNHTHLAVQAQTVYKGLSTDEVQSRLGEPRAILTEEPNQVWSYRFNNCTTLIYFNEKKEACFAETRGNCTKPAAVATTALNEKQTRK